MGYFLSSLPPPLEFQADHEGLKVALDHSMEKLGITINGSDKEIGMCSNGARVNTAMH